MLYRLRTGCQWKALPKEFGSGSTCHLRLQQWREAGVFKRIHAELLRHYDKKRGIRWDWSALDSAMVKAPKGGATQVPTRRTGRNSV
jgi:transposase